MISQIMNNYSRNHKLFQQPT